MRGRWLALLLLGACLPLRGLAQDQAAPGREASVFAAQVITADEIRRAGLTRLSELWWYVEGGRLTTVDGVSVSPSLGGLRPFGAGGWRVLIDGQPVEAGFWGMDALELLPVPLQAIDRVEVVDVPQLHRGGFAAGGLLHIHTRRIGPGPAAAAEVSAKNETGDPGPYRYLPGDPAADAQNVDSKGPDGALQVAYGGRTGGVRAGFRAMHHYLTDSVLIPRYLAVQRFERAARAVVFAPFVQGRGTFGGGAHAFTAGATRASHYPLLRAVGREVSMRYRFGHVAWGADYRLWGDGRLRHSLVYERQAADLHQTVSQIPVDWHAERVAADVAFSGPVASGTWEAGVAGGYVRARSALDLPATGAGVARAYAGLSGRSSWPGRYRLDGQVAADAHHVGVSASLQAEGAVGGGQAGVHLSFVQTLPAEQDALAFWGRRGLRLRTTSGPVALRLPEERVTNLLSAALRWRWRAGERLALRLGGALHHASRALYAEPELAYLEPAYETRRYVYGYAAGTRAEVQAAAEAAFLGGRQHLSYSFGRPVGGGARYRDAWRPVPRHRTEARLFYPVARSFSVQTRLLYFSSAFWPDYEGAASETGGRYRPEVPAALRLDLSLYKTFLQGRLQAGIAFENLLDRTIRYHPLGVEAGLAVKLRFALALGASSGP